MGLWRVPLLIGAAGWLLGLILASGLPWPGTLQRMAELLGDQWHRVSASDETESRVVIVEFPTAAQAQKFYDSPEYRAARQAR
ncbi:MAG: DUF1330 domain-containing protein, partial [Betaproteobacteria bacterium]|nr:DUF1330 domain-containing protein [Betaproteobacteria bacterium]